jgi:lipoyl-dependent peroxiredoxin
MKTLYEASVRVTGGRAGHATSSDGMLDLPLAFPTVLGGSGQGTNPEQLFAAGYAACFNASLRHAAKSLDLDAGDVTIEARTHLTVADGGAYGIGVKMELDLPGLAPADRDRVIAEAKRICAYSNATRGNVETDMSVR